jgi:toxin ParE1/3/4
MADVFWTHPALADVKDIAAFIAKDSPTYAARMAQRLLHSTRRLRLLPYSGGMVLEFGDPTIREVLVRPYRVIYAVRDGNCYVVAVVHGSRDLVALHSPQTLDQRADDL